MRRDSLLELDFHVSSLMEFVGLFFTRITILLESPSYLRCSICYTWLGITIPQGLGFNTNCLGPSDFVLGPFSNDSHMQHDKTKSNLLWRRLGSSPLHASNVIIYKLLDVHEHRSTSLHITCSLCCWTCQRSNCPEFEQTAISRHVLRRSSKKAFSVSRLMWLERRYQQIINLETTGRGR